MEMHKCDVYCYVFNFGGLWGGGKGVIKEGMLTVLALALELGVGFGCWTKHGRGSFFLCPAAEPRHIKNQKTGGAMVGTWVCQGIQGIRRDRLDLAQEHPPPNANQNAPVPESALKIDQAKHQLGLAGEHVLHVEGVGNQAEIPHQPDFPLPPSRQKTQLNLMSIPMCQCAFNTPSTVLHVFFVMRESNSERISHPPSTGRLL